MKAQHNRAFKEWAVSCEALREGRQTLLIRKGGIREDGGALVMNDAEFFLMPTYEHQKRDLLQREHVPYLDEIESVPRDWSRVAIDAYAVVDSILTARNMDQLRGAKSEHIWSEHIWNEQYLDMRFDFNPYDPLYLVVVRAYRLPEPHWIDMTPEYTGCRSWVTLERPISTQGAVPAIGDKDFSRRRDALLAALE